MFSFSQLIAHLIGDYFLQSNWMAVNKTSNEPAGWAAVTIHAIFYTVPFLLLTQSYHALLVIMLTHLVIDHFRVAKYIVWAKNWIQIPKLGIAHNKPWHECQTLGVPDSLVRQGPDSGESLVWLHGWLLFITDNTMHLIINGAALYWFG